MSSILRRSIGEVLSLGLSMGMIGSFPLFLVPNLCYAELRPEKIHVADNQKRSAYIEEGMFIGGDRAINSSEIESIRYASKTQAGSGFERMVIDTRVFENGKPPAIQRPGYYQVALSPETKQLTLTLWGSPKLGFNKESILSAFKKSSLIQRVRLFPRVEADSWTFTLDLKTPVLAEVFELNNPVRIIVDLKKSR